MALRTGLRALMATAALLAATGCVGPARTTNDYELANSINYLLRIPAIAALVRLVIWRVPFETMERIFGLMGLALIAFAFGVWRFGPDWGDILHQATHPSVPSGEGHPTYWYYAIALFGAAMTGGAGVAGSVARVRGLLAAAVGSGDVALQMHERALALHARLGLRPWEARSALELATALRLSGDHRGAESARRRAQELADRIGLALPPS